jgi:hypothetical protein
MNIFLDPAEQFALVEQAHIQISVAPDFLAGEEPKRPDTIVEVDQNNAVLRLEYKFCAVIISIRVGHETSTLNINPDGEFRLFRRVQRSKDIDKETVFGLVGIRRLSQTDTNGRKLAVV